ncbi:MAG: hypothetical protein IAE91_13095 [Ignavibacteriaceae bacterium]|nr:hypothetical protein [Ignavibacteriaceae bacterium]
MKKNNLVALIAFLAIAFFATGCNKDNNTVDISDANMYDSDTTLLKLTDVKSTGKFTVDRTYNFEKGQTFKYRFTSITETTQGVETDTSITIDAIDHRVYFITVRVLDVDDKGTGELEFTFAGIKIYAEQDTTKFSYTSGTLTDSLEKKKFFQFEALHNTPFVARIESNGSIFDMYKTDKIVDNMLTLGYGGTDSVSQEDRLVLKEEVQNSILKPLVGQVYRKFTPDKWETGGKWEEVKQPFNLQIVLINNTQVFEIKESGKFNNDEIINIVGSLKVNIEKNPELAKQGITIPVAEFDGFGNIFYDFTNKRIQKSATTTVLNMRTEGVAPGLLNPAVPIKFSQTEKSITRNYLEFLGK